jgi:zinc transport system substrate-binding protein
MKKLVLILFLFPFCSQAQEGRILTTTSTLKSLIQEMLPSTIQVESITPDKMDPHHFEISTRQILQMDSGDILFYVGLNYESAWLPKLLKTTKTKIKDVKNQIDLSRFLPERIPASEEALHSGHESEIWNPHYYLSPVQVAHILPEIEKILVARFPKQEKQIMERSQAFEKKLANKIADWQKQVATWPKKQIATYHVSLNYLAKDFKIETLVQVEEKHGVPPNAKHFQKVLTVLKENHVPCLFVETFYQNSIVDKIQASQKNLRIVPFGLEVGVMTNQDSYIPWIDYLFQELGTCQK